MNLSDTPTAVIAEDEPLLAATLESALAQVWPDLKIVATVGDGRSAVTQALRHKPEVLFFDIRMPGMTGLEAAAELADAWNTDAQSGTPFPALVFITAYDQYAIAAFEAQAIDYLLKPVQLDRLQKTVARVQLALANSAHAAINFEATLGQLRALLAGSPASAASPLKVIQASVGSSIRMVPVQDVVYFEAADKYVRVLTASHEYLIRTPLKDLLPQLDTEVFWQIHRASVVNSASIDAVLRDEAGRLSVSLRGRPEKLPVSRLYVHLFKAM